MLFRIAKLKMEKAQERRINGVLELLIGEHGIDILRAESFADIDNLFNYVIVYRHKYLATNSPHEVIKITDKSSVIEARVEAKKELVHMFF